MHRLYFWLSLFISFYSVCSSHAYEIEMKKDAWLHKEFKVCYTVDEQSVGSAYVLKLPLARCILHSLIIFPHYRGKGYAKAFLKHLCSQLEQTRDCTVYIQPGPYDMRNAKTVHLKKDAAYYKRRDRLVRIYQNAGFMRAPSWLCKLAQMLYKVLSINEDAEYLMIRES